MMAFSFLDPVLGPVLLLPPFWGLLLLSFVISLLITVIYKYTTDQNMMKQLKDEIKEFQKEIKELRSNPEKAMQVQKEAMKTNMKYMSMSMKATLITFIPIIFIFGWMSSHLAYESLKPGEPFTVTMAFNKPVAGDATLTVPPQMEIDGAATKEVSGDNVFWMVKGEKGGHLLEYEFGGRVFTQEAIITDGPEYSEPVIRIKDQTTDVKSLSINYQKKVVMNLGFWKPGWLATYIIFSIAFSLGLRKILKVY
jgi:uncharacterized membrane protein (DUF106 family)